MRPGEPSLAKPAEPIDAPAAQRREAAPPTIPNAAADVDRLASDKPGKPLRMSSDDTPQSLLEQFAALPPMNDSDSIEPQGRAWNHTATAALPLKPAPRVATNVDGLIGGGGRQLCPDRSPGPLRAANSSGRGGEGGSAGPKSPLTGIPRGLGGHAVPDAYRLRVAPNRADVVQSRGGTAATEAAVKAAPEVVGRQSGRRRPLESANPRCGQRDQRAWPRS